MRLTRNQQDALLRATRDRDNCLRDTTRTMAGLVNRNLAKYTDGYGHQFGAIVQLTPLGEMERDRIIRARAEAEYKRSSHGG